MPFAIRHFDDAPIILETMARDFSVKTDLPESIQQVQDILDRADTPHFFIIDATEAKVNLGDAISGMSMVTHGTSAVFKHANMRELLIVTTQNPITELTAKAFGQQQYGGLKVQVFSSLEGALEYAKNG